MGRKEEGAYKREMRAHSHIFMKLFFEKWIWSALEACGSWDENPRDGETIHSSRSRGGDHLDFFIGLHCHQRSLGFVTNYFVQ